VGDRLWLPGEPVDPSPAWEAVRAQVLLRPWAGRCEWCGQRPPTDAHHRLLKGQGGRDLPQWLAATDRMCHDFLHLHRVEAVARGFIVDSWNNPETVPMTLWDGMVVRPDEHFGYEILTWPG
jgi:hypothetical protein